MQRKIIYYIDVKTKTIKTCSTKRFNTEKNYYTDEVESILDNQVESKIGMIIRRINENINNEKFEIELDDEETEIIKKYLTYSFLRYDFFNEYLKEKMEVIDEIKDIKNTMISFESKMNLYSKIISAQYSFVIVSNNTHINFVLPSNYIYVFGGKENSKMILLPLTPRIAVLFFDAENLKRLNLHNKMMTFDESKKSNRPQYGNS